MSKLQSGHELRAYWPLLAVVVVTSCGRNSQPSKNTPTSGVHGELIDSGAVAENMPASAATNRPAKRKAQIPAKVSSLDGKKVVIEGFLLPVKMNDSLAVEFLLMRNQSMCCYGVPPKVNEWISVQLSGKGVKPVMDRPIAVAGVLHVGPIVENGCLAGSFAWTEKRF